MAVSAKDVKALRDRTGAAMMDCKAALEEAGGDPDKAVELLRVKGQASAAKRSGKATSEGVVASYIHAGRQGRASWSRSSARPTSSPAPTTSRSSPARSRSTSPALNPQYVSIDEIPEEAREAERRVFEAEGARGGQARQRDRADRRRAARQVGARTSSCSSRSTCARDRYDGKTIEQLRAELAAKTGENVRIARFARFAVGEE